jgi:hypothetical protein
MAVFIAALTGFIALLPNIIVGLIKDLLGVVDQIAVLAPKVVVALGVIIDTIIAFRHRIGPEAGDGHRHLGGFRSSKCC